MRIMTVLSAGFLFGGLIGLTTASTASAEVYAPQVPAVYAGALWYPYGHPWVPCHAYRHDVRFGVVPVAPKALLCSPTHYYGCPFYGPPYYAYPRPPLGCPGYAGFSGCDPNAYRTMVPPPIPTSSELQAYPQQPITAPEQLPTPPARVATPPKPMPPPSAPTPE
jgi:hypothetical protein